MQYVKWVVLTLFTYKVIRKTGSNHPAPQNGTKYEFSFLCCDLVLIPLIINTNIPIELLIILNNSLRNITITLQAPEIYNISICACTPSSVSIHTHTENSYILLTLWCQRCKAFEYVYYTEWTRRLLGRWISLYFDMLISTVWRVASSDFSTFYQHYYRVVFWPNIQNLFKRQYDTYNLCLFL